MAITKNQASVLFSAASSVTISSNTQADSDAYTPDVTAVALSVAVNANNSGTPASGDWVDIFVKFSNGDVDGTGGDDFDTNEHAQYLGRLNTYGSDNPGENPARKTWELPTSNKSFKLSYIANQASSRNIVLRATVAEQRSA